MKTIKKSIEITAPKESVWAVLLEDNYSRNWLSNFSPGSHAESDWIEGHKIVYKDDSGMGVFGKVAEKKPYEYIKIVYEGMVSNGEEDHDSEESKRMEGVVESYTLDTRNGNTVLSITSEMDEKYYDEMAQAWESALQRISELSHAI